MTEKEFDGFISLGAGRKDEPEFEDGKLINGTVYEGCPNSPDGYHHFTAIENIQSVETFKCNYCPKVFYD